MNEYPDRKSAIFAADEHRRIIRKKRFMFFLSFVIFAPLLL